MTLASGGSDLPAIGPPASFTVHQFVVMSVVVTVCWSVGMFVVYWSWLKIVGF